MFVEFKKSFNNNRNKVLLKSLQDNIDDDLNDLEIIKITEFNLLTLSFL